MRKPKAIILSQGCAANFGDGEKIARVLSSKYEVSFKFPESETAEEPTAFFLNVCTVKGNAGAMKLLRKVASAYPKASINITGCAPRDFRDEASRAFPEIQYTSLQELSTQEAKPAETQTACKNVLRESPFTGIVNIEEGCQDACAFCSTHLVKGRLHSFAEATIVNQVQSLVADGCKEIQLTGQDCGCYGFNTGTNLAKLIQNILAHVPGDYKIRLGMGNPRHVLNYLDELLECFQDERLYKFVHLPVQSGSERILKAMNRRHTADDYLKLAQAFHEHFENFTISTDMIVGFPGETDEDFEATMRLLKISRPTVCNITRFVARPGTPAYHQNEIFPVPDTLKHKRSAALAEAFQKIALENNSKWIGHEGFVVTEKNGYREGTTIARNKAYSPVALQGTYPAGQRLRVRITGAEPFALIAEPI